MLFKKKKKEEENKKITKEEKEKGKEEQEEFPELEEEEEEMVEEKYIPAKAIGDFWQKDIKGYSIDEVVLEVYKHHPIKGTKKIDFPYEDDRVTASGSIRPPLLLEELRAYGGGKYTVKVRDINTGQIIAVQVVKIYEEEEEPMAVKSEPKQDLAVKMLELQLRQNQQILETLMKLLVERTTQPAPQPSFDMSILANMFQKGVEMASTIKSKEIEAVLEKFKAEKEIELRKMDYEHELRKLKLTEGVTVGDVVDRLEEEGRVEEKDSFIKFIDGIVKAFGKLQDLLNSLGLIQQPTQPQPVGGPFRKPTYTPAPQPTYEEDFIDEEEWEEELEEEEIEKEEKPTQHASPEKTEEKQD